MYYLNLTLEGSAEPFEMEMATFFFLFFFLKQTKFRKKRRKGRRKGRKKKERKKSVFVRPHPRLRNKQQTTSKNKKNKKSKVKSYS